MLIPAIILMFLIITKETTLTKYFSKETLNKLSVSNQYFSNKARNITLFLALIFMIIALARPVTNERNLNSEQKTKAIVIALDVSKSMKAVDIYPNRLEFAKKKLLDIINYSKANAIGVILFAKSSYILSPITQDFPSLKILINNLDTGTNFDNGTNIYSVIENSKKLFENYSSRNLIILSDGGDNDDFKSEIEFANKNKINIYSIGLATPTGAAIKLENGNYLTDKNGKIVNLKLNEKIKDLCTNTNGGYINYSLDNNDIKQIIDDLNFKSKSDTFKQERFKVYTELFYYPLVLGIFLLLIAFYSIPSFSRKTTLFLLFISTFYTQDLKATVFDFQTIKEANEAYKNQNYKQASEKFKNIKSNPQRDYDLANAYYKEKKYDEAINLYKNINVDNLDLNFQRLHNLGNSYAYKNEFDKAIKTYTEALKLKDDNETRENLELIEQLKKDKKNQQQNKQQKKDDDSKKDNKEQKQENEKNQENKNSKDEQKKKEKQENQDNEKKEEDEKNLKKEKENKNIDESQISNLEEEKWLKQLENQKTNSLLKKMKSSNEDSSKNPW